MANAFNEEILRQIGEMCLEQYHTESTPLDLLQKAWELHYFPMHCPEHHYLIPAILLTVYHRYNHDDIMLLKKIC